MAEAEVGCIPVLIQYAVRSTSSTTIICWLTHYTLMWAVGRYVNICMWAGSLAIPLWPAHPLMLVETRGDLERWKNVVPECIIDECARMEEKRSQVGISAQSVGFVRPCLFRQLLIPLSISSRVTPSLMSCIVTPSTSTFLLRLSSSKNSISSNSMPLFL